MAEKAFAMWESFTNNKTFNVQQSHSFSSVLELDHWTPPCEILIKINCDAAVKKEFVSVACVARDSLGRLLESFRSRIPIQCSMMLAETLAIKEACFFCVKSGISSTVIKSDSAVD